MNHRRKGQGTILKSGNWYYGRIMIHGAYKTIKLSQNKRESEGLWAKWLETNRPSDLIKDSVKHDFADQWGIIEESLLASGNASKSTYKFEFDSLKDFLKENSVKYIEDVSRGLLVRYLEKRTEGKSDGTKHRIISALRKFWQEILPDLRPSDSPLRDFKTHSRKNSISRRPLSAEQITRLLESAEKYGKDWKGIILLSLHTGLRLKDCVYFHSSEVHDGVITNVNAKTHAKVVIPIHENLKEILGNQTEGYYFPELKEKYENHRSAFSAKLKYIFSKAGIETSVEGLGRERKASVNGFHSLRTTFVTRLAEKGVSLGVIQEMAGHVSPDMTMNYVHTETEAKKSAISALPDYVSGTDGETYVDPRVKEILDKYTAIISEKIEEVTGRKPKIQITANDDIMGGKDWFFSKL